MGALVDTYSSQAHTYIHTITWGVALLDIYTTQYIHTRRQAYIQQKHTTGHTIRHTHIHTYRNTYIQCDTYTPTYGHTT